MKSSSVQLCAHSHRLSEDAYSALAWVPLASDNLKVHLRTVAVSVKSSRFSLRAQCLRVQALACVPGSLSEPDSLAEPLPVLARSDEGLDHLGLNKVPVEEVQLGQPEVETGMIGVGSLIRIAPQIAKVLHQDESAIEFGAVQDRILSHVAQ